MMSSLQPSSDAIEAALTKVLASAAFRSRPNLRRLFTHLVQRSFAGNADSLKEYTLGVEVFGRGVRFDPLCDSIVRVEVFNLRRALRAYYRSEGATDLVIITVPKGGYRATFLLSEEPPAAILDDPERLCGQVEWSLLQATTADNISRLRHYVQHAIERWPGRPDLQVALASTVLAALEYEHLSPTDGVGLMRQAANAAVRLDATRGDAHFHAGIHEITSSHKEATIAAAHRWLDFAPKSAIAHFWMGSTLAANCRMSDAIVYLQQAARLQPYATCFQTWFAVALFCTGRTDAGLRHLRDILAFEPHDYLANYWLGLLATHARRYDEARDAAYRAHEVSGNPQALAGLGFIEATAQRVEAAEAILESLADSDKTRYVARSGVCQIYAALGRSDRAAREWTLARAAGDWELGWAPPDPRWNPLRGKVPGL
jgi:tetratricopeptide (TPR) repeat protein